MHVRRHPAQVWVYSMVSATCFRRFGTFTDAAMDIRAVESFRDRSISTTGTALLQPGNMNILSQNDCFGKCSLGMDSVLLDRSCAQRPAGVKRAEGGRPMRADRLSDAPGLCGTAKGSA